ncbi:MAG TPA: hypothetical protein VLA70_10810 [Nocardioides sp.]|nr:hypothetical protein [Nocardioides sp.]
MVDDSVVLPDTCENLWLRASGAARVVRPKDQVDFAVCAPLMDDGSRAWLRSALVLAHPGHRWLDAL